MARFALRNREKIIESHGKDKYDLIIASLAKYFKDNETIPETECNWGDKKIQCIFIPSIHQKSEIDFQFAIYRRNYDVLGLAFIGSVG